MGLPIPGTDCFELSNRLLNWIAVRKKKSQLLLFLSLGVNLGLLGVFKYYNFFVDNLIVAFQSIGFQLNITTLNIILPVGISFYTFQTLSYTIDVYREKIEPTKDWLAFFTFVSFFPQLVAGPIERAKDLLPQFSENRKFRYDQAVDGMRQLLLGTFKKVVIADNCGILVDQVYNNWESYPGSALLLASILFAFQIYGDFSGYSDIAIGSAKLFGIDLKQNFRIPYFSRDIAEFWRRWHISLSSWFKDYLYIPLGGSRGGRLLQLRNTFLIFVVSGFWHGANWTFIFWGFLNALYFLPLLLLNKNRQHTNVVAQGRRLPSVKECSQLLITFALTVLAWIFFRAESMEMAFGIIKTIFSETLWTTPGFRSLVLLIAPLIIILLLVEWLSREKEHSLEISTLPKSARWGIYLFFILLIYFCGVLNRSEFIYFQF